MLITSINGDDYFASDFLIPSLAASVISSSVISFTVFSGSEQWVLKILWKFGPYSFFARQSAMPAHSENSSPSLHLTTVFVPSSQKTIVAGGLKRTLSMAKMGRTSHSW